MWFKQVTHSSCPDSINMASSCHLPRLLALPKKVQRAEGFGGRETEPQCKVGPGTLWGTVTQSLTVCGVIKAAIAAIQTNKGQGEIGAVHR